MDVVAQLTEALPGKVETDPAVLEHCRRDRSGLVADGLPLAVVRAASIDDVQISCRIASATGTTLVSRGAGTGLAGGGIVGAGEIVLSTTGMTRILEISPANQYAVVEPGILNGDLNRELRRHGLWWPPDPASKDISTVGGNIATNAGGLLCAKYGVTREAVLALKVVLADGSLISVGHKSVKGVTGYDLCALMIGSEGTLGVIVECTLKLRPVVTGTVVTIGAFFDSVDLAATAAARITAAGLQPAVMEILDHRTLDCVGRFTGTDLTGRGDSYFLVQCDGGASLQESSAILDIIHDTGGTAEATTDPVESERMIDVRRQGFPALEAMGTLLVEDVAVPRDRMLAVFQKIAELEDKYAIMIPTACHAGDGNLHPSFVFHGDSVPEEVWHAAEELFAFVLTLGGTLSGEHGIGVLKRRWLRDELGDGQFEIQKRIKTVFDPRNILNRGRVFDSGVSRENDSSHARSEF